MRPPEVEHPIMRRSTSLIIALPLLLSFLIGGCSTLNKVNPFASKKAPPLKNHRFSDLPVPRGLTLDPEDSFIFESPGTRAGTLVYSGFKKYADAVSFYRQKMPEHGWKLVNSIERDEASLTFEKPGWSAAIFIRALYFGRSKVSINLGPRGKSLVEENIPPRR